jgi:hypothetical protein
MEDKIIAKMNKIILQIKDNYRTKIDKISIASYDSSAIISLKRISRHMRTYMYYSDFMQLYKDNKNDFEIIKHLDKIMLNGLIIVLLNEDIFSVVECKNDIDKFVFDRIGSDNNISSIILIKRCHNNKFINLETILEKFNILKEKYKWKVIEKIKKDNSGNEKWRNHYAISTKGGEQYGKIEGEIQLANNISEYCNIEISKIIKYYMVYYMFHSIDSEEFLVDNNKKNSKQYIILFDTFCKLKNIVLDNDKFIENGYLKCFISGFPISYSDFEKEQIQLCHIEPVSKSKIRYDKIYGILCSHHYNNLSWGFKIANMLQLDNSIEDTHKFVMKMTLNILKKFKDNDEAKETIKHLQKVYDNL